MIGWRLSLTGTALALLFGCSGAVSDPPGSGGGATEGSAGDKRNWSYIYATYFGPGTPGHCGDARCHAHPRGGFECATKDGCYLSLTGTNPNFATPLVDTKNWANSALVDPAQSPLIWFNASGTMPFDNAVPNSAATAEIGAWISAGARND